MCLLICLSIILVSGCSDSELTKLNKSYDQEKQKNVELEKEKAVLNEELENLNRRLDKQVAIIATLTRNPAKGMELYPIYSADVDNYKNNYKKEIDFDITMPKEDSLKRKLDTIADTLSVIYFGNLPIKVLEIDDNKIATINLEETSEKPTNTAVQKTSSWSTGFFQGSTGGTITTIRLSESFLQKDYEGEWIKGIRFLYKGKPIDFEHTPELSEVIYRS